MRDQRSGARSSTSTSPARSRARPRGRCAKRAGGAPFPLSERHGAWRVALDGGRTVDFTPLPGPIEDDLAQRATSRSMRSPSAGRRRAEPRSVRRAADLERGDAAARVRTASSDDDPLRLLRAVRLEDELGFRIDPETEELVRARRRARDPAGGRADPRRAAAALGRRLPAARRRSACWRRSAAGSTTGSTAGTRPTTAWSRSSATSFAACRSRTSCAASPPRCCAPSRREQDARSIHRFRRATEPWALEALAFAGASELAPRSRRRAPTTRPSRCCAATSSTCRRARRSAACSREIEEERAAGTIATKEEALDYARRNAGAVRRRRLSGSPRCRTHARRSSRRRCCASSRRRVTSGCSTPAAARAPSPSRSRRTCARWSRSTSSPSCSSRAGAGPSATRTSASSRATRPSSRSSSARSTWPARCGRCITSHGRSSCWPSSCA